MKYTIKLILKNVLSFSLLISTLGILINAVQHRTFPGNIIQYTLTGLALGLAISLVAILMDAYVSNRRRNYLDRPPLSQIREHFKLIRKHNGYAGLIHHIPVFVFWNMLPVNKKISPGISIHFSFSPLHSEKLYELKKKTALPGRVEWDSFMLKWFVPFKMSKPSGYDQLLQQIDHTATIIRQFSPDNLSQRCIQCKAPINNELQIINDVPVYICDQCKNSI